MRVRPRLLRMLGERLARYGAADLADKLERAGLPFAPIRRPEDLFDDPHLLETGGLAPLTIHADATGAGRTIETRTALLPLAIDGQRLALRSAPPSLGTDTVALLSEIGYDAARIDELVRENVIGIGPPAHAPAPQPPPADA